MDDSDSPHRKRRHRTWNPACEPRNPSEDPGVELALLGTVSAGSPIEHLEDPETIVVPTHMTRAGSYALRVRGDSMVEDGIHNGDIVIVDPRPTAETGTTVVARIDGERVTLKRFYPENDRIRLQPANPDIEPLILHDGDIEILGVVSGVVVMSA
ncbi:LexA family protein [Thiocapsa marina]|uniref:Peptidase S24/S26A/S26B, conserved region n=1 Tax=Thiocapsa marina 5811 TaxID=768671 RepID=F9UGB8_9GAMM|nr:S24 family peptidase [Thiocapsa marina]EGV16844.1 Peptidase S24/S26A/S26B, conserved region [Thiocapsa marina 5811]